MSDIDLTNGSLTKNLKHLAIPVSVGYLFNTMYNIVDSYWAGQLSTNSLAALSLNFPLYIFVMALGVGFSAASGALIPNVIGSGEVEKSKTYFSQSISLFLIFSVITSIILILFLEEIFTLLKAQGVVLRGALDYGFIIVLGMPFINITPVLSSALSSRGDTKSYSNILIAVFLLNIVLDPLFMYTFNMNEAGFALATVLIQIISMLYLLFKVTKANALQGLTIKDFIPDKAYTKEIIEQGVPGTANFLTMSLGTFYSYILLFQSNALLQGLKRPALILWMGLYRQIFAPAIVFYILCFTFSMRERGVWVGLIFINWSAAIYTLIWALRYLKERRKDCGH